MDVADYFDVLRRHRGWIMGPLFAGVVVAVVVAFVWPDTYVSDATIRIVPPAVPERYVPSNVNLQIGQRIASMEQSVRSRTTILNLINENGLYPRKKGRIPDEDLVEVMQKDVRIAPVMALREMSEARGFSTAFRVSFAYENRYLAQKVVSQIVGKFLDETVRTRSTESVMTTEFLKEKLDAAKKNLDQIENRLTEYKLRFSGKLPENLSSNLGQLNSLQTQLAALGSSINRATQEKLLLENSLRSLNEQLQAALTQPVSSVDAAVKSDRIIQLDRQILALDTAIAGMRQQYSDSHPDVRRARSQLASLRTSREGLMKEEEKASAAQAQTPRLPNPSETREQRQIQTEIARVQSLIETKDMEAENLAKEQARINKTIKVYQERIESSPLGEREYALMTRDYNLAKQQYEELVLKSTQSSMATDLETRKQGETLEVLEQASLPQTPTEPNRLMIIAAGSVIGLMLGLFLAGGREMNDTSLKNLKDVRAYTGLPVLGSVPLVENDLLVQRKRRLTWVAWSGACIVGVLLMLGSVYYYFTKPA
jgi:polysaccharide chain length determinant protein (PEP-CTERM system associated)